MEKPYLIYTLKLWLLTLVIAPIISLIFANSIMDIFSVFYPLFLIVSLVLSLPLLVFILLLSFLLGRQNTRVKHTKIIIILSSIIGLISTIFVFNGYTTNMDWILISSYSLCILSFGYQLNILNKIIKNNP